MSSQITVLFIQAWACAVVATELYVPSFGRYPGYTGDLVVSGSMTIATTSLPGKQKLTWSLGGVDTTCSSVAAGTGIANACGVHIHLGTSCDDHEGVGGHYHSSFLSEDPWQDVVYVASADGTATEQGIEVVTGLSMAEIVGRAMIVHELAEGGRIACGIIGTEMAGLVQAEGHHQERESASHGERVRVVMDAASRHQTESVQAEAAIANKCVLVTGATGPSGLELYKLLQKQGVCVRALVRNATKAQEKLGCKTCDASEGIFVGDIVKDDDPLAEAAKGVSSLAIMTSAIPTAVAGGVGYTQMPVDVDWHAARAQLQSFVKANGGKMGHVVLMSTMGTTTPNGPLDKIGDGMIGFYKLNFEAFLMASGVPYTIIKACGLDDTAPGKRELLVGNHDELSSDQGLGIGQVSRADVARVIYESLVDPLLSIGVRTDICSGAGATGADGTDFKQLLAKAHYPR